MKQLLQILLLLLVCLVKGQIVVADRPLKLESTDLFLQKQLKIDDKKPCCPYCKSDSAVIIKSSDTCLVIHYQFKNKRSLKKYYKKKELLGYETCWDLIWPDLINEKEILVWIGIKEEKENFLNSNCHWFCKKCKKIF